VPCMLFNDVALKRWLASWFCAARDGQSDSQLIVETSHSAQNPRRRILSETAMFHQLRDSFRVADQPPSDFPEVRFWITWVGGGKKPEG
jgi:hypothetical protein